MNSLVKHADLPSSSQFYFIASEWDIVNKATRQDGTKVEFSARNWSNAFLDGRLIIDHYEAELLNGFLLEGIMMRAFNPETEEWLLVWLENRSPPDFRPLIGRFDGEVGQFFQELEAVDGSITHVWFIWDNITPPTARWQQAFSNDGQQTW